jgi:hypothetical protein
MADELNGNGSVAVTVAVYAALTYDIISATNSSPQTTEINAASRAETLMKWVKLGLAQAALFVAMGMLLDKRRWPPLAGGGLAGVLLWVQYVHARSAGLKSVKPGTESTAPAAPGAAFTWGTRT